MYVKMFNKIHAAKAKNKIRIINHRVCTLCGINLHKLVCSVIKWLPLYPYMKNVKKKIENFYASNFHSNCIANCM